MLLILLGIGYLGKPDRGLGIFSKPMEDCLYVEATGRVSNPGVFRFHEGPVTLEALCKKAGAEAVFRSGEKDFAVRTIEQGTRVMFELVHGRPFLRMIPMGAYSRVALGLKIALNRISAEELTALPGVGPALAADIVIRRAVVGGFRDERQLLEVDGIGRQTLDRMRPYLDFS